MSIANRSHPWSIVKSVWKYQSLGFFLLIVLTGCPPSKAVIPHAVNAKPSFRTSASFSSLNIKYETGATGQYSIIESLGGGVGLLDYDRDGRLDLCCPGGGQIAATHITGKSTRLVRQVDTDVFLQVEHQARMDGIKHFSHGCSVADYDNDGFPDVLITGYGGLTLWRNMGDGTFLDVTQSSGLTDDQWSSSAAWGDVNGDGILDLFVAHYVNWSYENNPDCRIGPEARDVCPPRRFDGLDDRLYFGDGAGGFIDRSTESGLVPGGKGLGVVLADFDQDGDLDIYVANDTTPNFYYRNNGHGRFQEDGVQAGVALDDMANANGSMGLTLIASDCAGAPDIWVTTYEDELFALYQNQKDGFFLYASRKAGLNHLGQLFVGFGCVTGDFDGDGDEDVAVSNGHVIYHPVNAPVRQTPLMMLNNGHQQFERMAFNEDSYFSGRYVGRGVATGDLNNDGLLDLVFVHSDQPTTVLYNTTSPKPTVKSPIPAAGSIDHHLCVRLIGVNGPRDGIGAQATLVTTKRKQGRQLYGGGSYLSTSDLRLYWGIGTDERVQELKIVWPGGKTSNFSDSDLRQTQNPSTGEVTLREP